MSDTVLVFEGAEPWRLLVAVAAMGCAAALAWLGLRNSTSRWRRSLLITLRTTALATLAVLLLQPVVQQRQLSPIKRRLALLVDASQSMALPVAQGVTRAQAVARFLARERNRLAELMQRFELAPFRFDTSLHPAALADIADKADGIKTDLLAALSQLAGRSDGTGGFGADLAAVVMISDGTDTAQLTDHARGSELPEAVRTLLSAFEVPVNTVAVGAQSAFRDLAISRVATDDFAFIRNAVEVEVHLSSVGLDEMSVPLVLEQAGRNLASKTVRVGPGQTRKVTLKFVPDRVGELVYRVSTPVLPGETLAGNNAFTFVTRIIRDKIRVLHLVGRPSWDERFLRQVLKRNPNIDLVSFFILRTTTDAPGVSQDELSLIPFPVAELFTSELPTFDVVIFQNFNHGPYQVAGFLPQLAEYITGGGALLMIGGDLSFGAGGYATTVLEEVLAVRLRAEYDLVVEEFRAVPTSAGARHPVMGFAVPEVWARLPPLASYNRALAVQPDTQVLLEHPFERSAARRAPVLALREVGRGRTAALLTDGSWRWNFVYAGVGGSPRIYHRLYNNLLRWLVRDPALQAVSLRADRSRYLPQEPVRLSARLRGWHNDAQVRLELFAAGDPQPVERRTVELDEGGRAELELGRLAPGAYLARFEATRGSRSAGSAEDAFVVAGEGREHNRPIPRPDLLERIAAATGGRALDLEGGSLADLATDAQQRYRVEASTTRPLIGRLWVLVGLILLLATEWWLRRRWGFA